MNDREWLEIADQNANVLNILGVGRATEEGYQGPPTCPAAGIQHHPTVRKWGNRSGICKRAQGESIMLCISSNV